MKKKVSLLSCCLTLSLACASKPPAQEGAGSAAKGPARIVVSGFATPESVLHDGASDTYLVSNINGKPLAADGNGFISKIAPDGSVISLKWIDGSKEGVDLNAPKGMAIQGGVLYVADLTQVRMFDIATGQPQGSIDIPGSSFLNDMCDGPEGSVYVSDSGLKEGAAGFVPSGTDAIYQIKADGSYKAIATGDALGRPNGILAQAGGVMVVTFGSGEVYTIDANGQRQDSPKPPKGALDGLVRLADGRHIISSWGGSALYILENGKYSLLATALDAPADIGFDSKRQRVLVPLFKQNKVVILPLSPK